MTTDTGPATASLASAPPDTARLYQEGIVAGLVGAATVAVWFLILDTLAGRPFYTPTVLGTALFRRGQLGAVATLAPSLEMVLMFTWVHGLAFAALGGLAARLIWAAERNPSVGFGVLLLFVVFTAGFTIAAMLFAAPVLQALTWPAVLVANLLAALAMTLYFRLRHPTLRVNP